MSDGTGKTPDPGGTSTTNPGRGGHRTSNHFRRNVNQKGVSQLSKTASVEGMFFDCSTPRSADLYEKSIEKLVSHVGRAYAFGTGVG